ncbi:MAG: hypothetical protein OXC84_10965 [Gammaproteobacteria bacterium]|nr:hypothetical protein [Gammaproteobacteria bacterium]
MSFGLNRAEVIGRRRHGQPPGLGGRVANLSIATDESYVDKSGERIDKTEWRRALPLRGPICYLDTRTATRNALDDRGPVVSLNRRGGSQPLWGRRLRRWRCAGRKRSISTPFGVLQSHRSQNRDVDSGTINGQNTRSFLAVCP